MDSQLLRWKDHNSAGAPNLSLERNLSEKLVTKMAIGTREVVGMYEGEDAT